MFSVGDAQQSEQCQIKLLCHGVTLSWHLLPFSLLKMNAPFTMAF